MSVTGTETWRAKHPWYCSKGQSIFLLSVFIDSCCCCETKVVALGEGCHFYRSIRLLVFQLTTRSIAFSQTLSKGASLEYSCLIWFTFVRFYTADMAPTPGSLLFEQVLVHIPLFTSGLVLWCSVPIALATNTASNEGLWQNAASRSLLRKTRQKYASSKLKQQKWPKWIDFFYLLLYD